MTSGLAPPTFTPIRTLEIVERDGRRVRALHVFCGRGMRSVSPDACAACEHMYATSSAGVVCAIPAPRPARGSRSLFLGPQAVSHGVAVGAALGSHALFVRVDAPSAAVRAALAHAEGVVVVSREGAPVGTIAAATLPDEQALAESDTAEELMDPRTATVPEASPLSQAIGLMTYRHARLVPVVNEVGVAVGLFTELDALHWARGGRR